MEFEPRKFAIGVTDIFSVLLPGAILAFALMRQVEPSLTKDPVLSGTGGWLAFLLASYVLGHFIFLIGAFALDDFVYDPIRDATLSRQIARLAEGRRLSLAPLRFLARHMVKKGSDEAQERVVALKKERVKFPGAGVALNAFNWCKARLVLDNHAEAFDTVLRLEADSKFFRSFSVVSLLLAVEKISKAELDLTLLGLAIFFFLSLWRYFEQRLKSVNQAYWYMLAQEGTKGADVAAPGPAAAAKRVGGVVYCRKGKTSGTSRFLLVCEKTSSAWVLPNGRSEPGESAEHAAVRKVWQEARVLARVVQSLSGVKSPLEGESVGTEFFLMEALECQGTNEPRMTSWESLEQAVAVLADRENPDALTQASNLHVLTQADKSLSSRK